MTRNVNEEKKKKKKKLYLFIQWKLASVKKFHLCPMTEVARQRESLSEEKLHQRKYEEKRKCPESLKRREEVEYTCCSHCTSTDSFYFSAFLCRKAGGEAFLWKYILSGGWGSIFLFRASWKYLTGCILSARRRGSGRREECLCFFCIFMSLPRSGGLCLPCVTLPAILSCTIHCLFTCWLETFSLCPSVEEAEGSDIMPLFSSHLWYFREEAAVCPLEGEWRGEGCMCRKKALCLCIVPVLLHCILICWEILSDSVYHAALKEKKAVWYCLLQCLCWSSLILFCLLCIWLFVCIESSSACKPFLWSMPVSWRRRKLLKHKLLWKLQTALKYISAFRRRKQNKTSSETLKRRTLKKAKPAKRWSRRRRTSGNLKERNAQTSENETL